MNEGLKCWLAEDKLGGRMVDATISEKVYAAEGRVFTPAELAARDKAIKEAFGTAYIQQSSYDNGFAAGVEEAANYLAALCEGKTNHNKERCGCARAESVRTLLPPGYKSPAEIRREALEKVQRVLEGCMAAAEMFLGFAEQRAVNGCIEGVRALAEEKGEK